MQHDGSDVQVLIVGAGPTGLVLALYLQRLGIAFRIVDKAQMAGATSRALVVHARTLEFYRQLGVADAVIEGAQKFAAVNLWVKGRRRARVAFGDIGEGLSAFPYSLILPQDEHERLLSEALTQRHITIERGQEVVDVAQHSDGVSVRLKGPSGSLRTCQTRYVAGCDGAHSIVREKLQIGLPGGTYDHIWYVADVDADGPLTNHEVNISMDNRDVIAVFPMKGEGKARLIGQAPVPPPGETTVTWESVDQRTLRELHTSIRHVSWFSTYRVHHRVAASFRNARVFLLGDAAHLHSPVGGQGMNTGIGDAANLAWKLATVLQGRADEQILDSYEPERISFARALVSTTDRVFAVLNSATRPAAVFRTVIAPAFLPLIMRTKAGRRFMFTTLSQIAVRYRKSPLSRGRAGRVAGGDRLPWIALAGSKGGCSDNFAPLNAVAWQAHIYGEALSPLRQLCDDVQLDLHVFPWDAAMHRAALVRDAVYLVRPDGHVAYVNDRADAANLRGYITDQRLAFGTRSNIASSAGNDGDDTPQYVRDNPVDRRH